MDQMIVLRQGEATVVLTDKEAPTIVTNAETEQLVIDRSGATFETHINNASTTYLTEVTQVIEPEDPGDLTLLFDNKLI